MDGQKNIRAFLAVEPTEDVLQAVSRLQENLKKEIKGKISWTRPQGNHITLKFFGNIDQDDVKNICAIIKNQIASVPTLSLNVETDFSTFKDRVGTEAIWFFYYSTNIFYIILINVAEKF